MAVERCFEAAIKRSFCRNRNTRVALKEFINYFTIALQSTKKNTRKISTLTQRHLAEKKVGWQNEP